MSASSKQEGQPLIDQTVAVNAYGWAIIDNLASTRTRNAVINCYPPNSLSAESALNVTNKDPIERHSLVLTDRELENVGSSHTRKYLVVGYAYPDTTEAKKLTKCAVKKARPAGTENNPATVIQLPKGELPWLVVTEIVAEKTQWSKFHVLFHPQDGLCQPYAISKKLTFFFHEFRNDATSIGARLKDWNNKVRDKSVIAENVQLEEDGEETRGGDSADTDIDGGESDVEDIRIPRSKSEVGSIHMLLSQQSTFEEDEEPAADGVDSQFEADQALIYISFLVCAFLLAWPVM